MQVNKKHKTIFPKLAIKSISSDKLIFSDSKNKKNGHYLKKTNRRKSFAVSTTILATIIIASVLLVNSKIFADGPSYLSMVQVAWSTMIGDDLATNTITTSLSDKYSKIDDNIEITDGIKLKTSATANERGSLTSAVFDTGVKPYFDYTTFSIDNAANGTAQIQFRSDKSADMSTAQEWSTCKYLKNEESVYGLKNKNGEETNKCMRRPERYIQYKITLINNDIPGDFKVNRVSFLYNEKADTNGPESQISVLSPLSSKIQNHLDYTYTWNQAESLGLGWYDEESGVAGVKYCLADGFMDNGGAFSYCDPNDHPERYVGPNGVNDENGTFKYAGGTHEYISDVFPIKDNRLTTNPNYPAYKPFLDGTEQAGIFLVFIRAIDNVGNFQSADFFDFKVDKYSTMPSGPPKNLTSTNTVKDTNMFSFDWDTPSLKDNAIYNHYLGTMREDILAYIKDLTPQQLKALLEPKYGIEIDIGEELTPEELEDIIDQIITAITGDAITDRAVLFTGSLDELSYCYAVNKSPNPDPEDEHYDEYDAGWDWKKKCTRTAVGAVNLPASNYGRRQGINHIYMASINEAGNIDPIAKVGLTEQRPDPSNPGKMISDSYGNPIDFPVLDPITLKQVMLGINNYSVAEFEVKTLSPDLPQKPEVTDISNRTDKIWRVVLSWMKPKDDVPKVEKYQIVRSTDNITWADAGYTDSLSYVDTDPILNNETKYYYQIRACDDSESCSKGVDAINIASKDKSPGITPNGHYTESASLVGNPKATSVGTKKAVIEWQTSRESDSAMFISTSPNVSIKGDYSVGNSNQVLGHSLNLNNLQPDTKYYYKTTWTDIDNNTGVSPELSFSTTPSPLFSEVNFKDISISGSTVSFTVKDASKVNMYFGKTESFGGINVVNTSSVKSTYSVNLTNLDDNTKYYIRLNGFDADGNEYSGNVNSFTTLTRPKISNLKFQPVADAASNTTKVSWNTNVPATSILNYGIVGGKQLETISSKLTTEHEITIAGLDDNSTYSLVARSRDAYDNLAVSDVQTFKTALDTRPPKISKITADTTIRGTGAEAKGQVIVSWTTDELATSQVAFGQGAPGIYNNKTAEDSTLSYEHTVVISDLSTSSIYQVQPVSRDGSKNLSKGANQSAIIGRGTEDVFMIIFSALRNIFGIKG